MLGNGSIQALKELTENFHSQMMRLGSLAQLLQHILLDTY